MDAIEAILKRESVRSYKSEQISDKDLETIVEAGKKTGRAAALSTLPLSSAPN